MTRQIRVIVFLFAIAVTAARLSAQQAAPAVVDITEEPSHRLVLQNDLVRVFQVQVLPGQATLFHRHVRPYAYVSIGDAEVRSEATNKPPVSVHARDGEVKFVAGPLEHRAVNVGKSTFRNITVELLRTTSEAGCCSVGGVAESAAVDSGSFSQAGWRFEWTKLAPQQSIAVDNRKRNYLLVAVTDMNVGTNPDDSKHDVISLRAGEVKWMTGGVAQRWRNDGRVPVRFVMMEFGQ